MSLRQRVQTSTTQLQNGGAQVSSAPFGHTSSVGVDNATPNWLYLTNAGLYIAPYTIGYITNYFPAIASETVIQQSPTGTTTPNPNLPDNGVTISAYDDVIPPSPGVSYAISPKVMQAITDGSNVSSDSTSVSWDSNQVAPNPIQQLDAVISINWRYQGYNDDGTPIFVGDRQTADFLSSTATQSDGNTVSIGNLGNVGNGSRARLMGAVFGCDTTGLVKFGIRAVGPPSPNFAEVFFTGYCKAGSSIPFEVPANGIIVEETAQVNVGLLHSIVGATISYTIWTSA